MLYDCLLYASRSRADRRNVELSCETVEKAKSAVSFIQKWRRVSANKPVSALIWGLMHETDFYLHACAMPGGDRRRANLLKLFEYARVYEKTSYKGIFNFLRFIDKLIDQGGDLAEAKIIGANEDSVRILSIHKSKGLEFPVVFLAGCGKSFNTRDSSNDLLLHRNLGFGPNYVDLERRIIDDTIAKRLIAEAIRRETLSEEMRILYVALTRAKTRLYVVGTLNDADAYYRKIENLLTPYAVFGGPRTKLPPEIALKADKFLFWLISALDKNDKYPVFVHSADSFINLDENAPPADIYNDAADLVCEPGGEYTRVPGAPSHPETDSPPSGFEEALRSRLMWAYPYEWLFDIPRKVTVSDIAAMRTSARRFTEGDGDGETPGGYDPLKALSEAEDADRNRRGAYLATPGFLHSAGEFTRAQIGTYTHLVLEKIDYSRVTDIAAVEDLINRLTDNKSLTPEQAAAVDRRSVMNFLSSEAGRLAAGADMLNRETIFTVKLTLAEYAAITYNAGLASKISSIPSLALPEMPFVLMQGAIDCWFETPEGIVLIDYKTGFSAEGDLPDAVFEKYKIQIELYALALKKITGREVYKKIICLLSADKYIEL